MIYYGNDTPNHAIFECMEFEEARNKFQDDGEPLTRVNLVHQMLESREGCNNASEHYAKTSKGRMGSEKGRRSLSRQLPF
ncbi:jg20410 [Pararge aegeria aegeria]|uniref:Jg20410 protein n=1 Tax=Pararge aegeria aegeria TaxID=348720 RepID=A0A8S4R1I0_9NEOP|nr:jg20410 [Pararge aegeria aegeria]